MWFRVTVARSDGKVVLRLVDQLTRQGHFHKVLYFLRFTPIGMLIKKFAFMASLRRLRSQTHEFSSSKSPNLSLQNEDITCRFAQVMLVDEKGVRQPTPVSPATLLTSMDRHRYDLVLVNAEHVPPLVRLRPRSAVYERERAQEAAAALQRLRTREKEVRFSTTMASADRERRLEKVKELLAGAYRVKLLVEGGGTGDVRGREQLGRGLLAMFMEAYGKDLSLICPPDTGVGHWSVTIQSASAEPALLKRRQELKGGRGCQ